MGTVFIQKEQGDSRHVRLINSTGADLVQYELTVINGLVLVADEAIIDGERGSFAVMEDISGQINEFVAAEDTFGTANDPVYWDPTSGDFSDTSTAGYYPVGTVEVTKNSNDVVLVYFNRNTEAVV